MIYGPNPTSEQVLRTLEPYEHNNRCLKSIKTSLQPAKAKMQNTHHFKSTTTRSSFAFMNRVIPTVTATEFIQQTEVPQQVRPAALKETKEQKLRTLVGKSMWALVNLEKRLVPGITSQPKPSKYDLKDTFFRKAFIQKPKVS